MCNFNGCFSFLSRPTPKPRPPFLTGETGIKLQKIANKKGKDEFSKENQSQESLNELHLFLTQHGIQDIPIGRFDKKEHPKKSKKQMPHTIVCAQSLSDKKELFIIQGSQIKGTKCAKKISTKMYIDIQSIPKNLDIDEKKQRKLELDAQHIMYHALGKESYCTSTIDSQTEKSYYFFNKEIELKTKATAWFHPVENGNKNTETYTENAAVAVQILDKVMNRLMRVSDNKLSFRTLPTWSMIYVSTNQITEKFNLIIEAPDAPIKKTNVVQQHHILKSLLTELEEADYITKQAADALQYVFGPCRNEEFATFVKKKIVKKETFQERTRQAITHKNLCSDILLMRVESPMEALHSFIEHFGKNSFFDPSNQYVRIDEQSQAAYLNKSFSFKHFYHSGYLLNSSNRLDFRIPYSVRRTHDGEVLIMTNLGPGNLPLKKAEGGFKYVRFQYSLTQEKWIALKIDHSSEQCAHHDSKKTSENDTVEQRTKETQRNIIETVDLPLREVSLIGKPHAMIMEKMDGDLTDFIASVSKNKAPIPRNLAIGLTIGLMQIMKNLHQKKVLHRDLKIENILYKYDKTSKIMTLMLDDFDLSKVLKGNYTIYETLGGTLKILAPELMISSKNAIGIKQHAYTVETDRFALGVLLGELFCDMTDLFQRIEYENESRFKNRLTGYTFLSDGYLQEEGMTEHEVNDYIDNHVGKKVNLSELTYRDVDYIKTIIKKCLTLDPSQRVGSDFFNTFISSGRSMIESRFSNPVIIDAMYDLSENIQYESYEQEISFKLYLEQFPI